MKSFKRKHLHERKNRDLAVHFSKIRHVIFFHAPVVIAAAGSPECNYSTLVYRDACALAFVLITPYVADRGFVFNEQT